MSCPSTGRADVEGNECTLPGNLLKPLDKQAADRVKLRRMVKVANPIKVPSERVCTDRHRSHVGSSSGRPLQGSPGSACRFPHPEFRGCGNETQAKGTPQGSE